MDAFLAIERILLVHHSTSRQPLSFGTLRFRTMKIGKPIMPNDIATILAVWPSAYTVCTERGQQMLECPDLPHAADRRRATFTDLWEKKENLVGTNVPSPCSMRSGPAPEPLLQRPGNTPTRSAGRVTKAEPKRRVLMGTQKQLPSRNTNSMSLLDRIRAKEATLRVTRSPQNIQKQTDVFLGSQVPKLKRVLSELAASKDTGVLSFELDRMMEIMRENMVKLGDDELQRCLELLSQLHPSFCTIVTCGDSTFVKLKCISQPRQHSAGPSNAAVECVQSVAVYN